MTDPEFVRLAKALDCAFLKDTLEADDRQTKERRRYFAKRYPNIFDAMNEILNARDMTLAEHFCKTCNGWGFTTDIEGDLVGCQHCTN